MATSKGVAALKLGDEITGSITVRGSGMTEQIGVPLASPRLDIWQTTQNGRLAETQRFEAVDSFSHKPQGEYSVTRTLTVRAK